MEIVISDIGMISAVGHGAATSCAAIRAGVSRPMPLAGQRGIDLDLGATTPFKGFPIDGVTNGFAGLGLWKRLGERALRDMMGRGPRPERDRWDRTGLHLVLPDLDADRFLLDEPLDMALVRSELGVGLIDLLELPIPSGNVEVACRGHAGALEGLETAAARIASGALDRCIVLGVDSYVDTCSLDWLAARSRLKTDEAPTGLMPGEAGACVLIESEAAARRARVTPRAALKAVATAHVHRPWSDPGGRNGRQLARAVESVLAGSGLFTGDVVIDLNGESWRAQEVGAALTHLADGLGPGVRWLKPAASLGDTGAASGVVALCLAVMAQERGWAAAGETLVVSLSDDGAVGAARVAGLRPGRG